jgi:hypothetical protein
MDHSLLQKIFFFPKTLQKLVSESPQSKIKILLLIKDGDRPLVERLKTDFLEFSNLGIVSS